MGRITTNAHQLRMQLRIRLGRRVTMAEVIASTGIQRRSLARIEKGKAMEYDVAIMQALGDYYHRQGLDTTNFLRYEPDPDKQETPEPA